MKSVESIIVKKSSVKLYEINTTPYSSQQEREDNEDTDYFRIDDHDEDENDDDERNKISNPVAGPNHGGPRMSEQQHSSSKYFVRLSKLLYK